ncbi:MAG: imidazole glycerol phosphate synthase subunit HisH, partial [Polaromonas sp.]
MANVKRVAVVDYGSGNLRSVSQAVQHVAEGSGYEVLVTSRAQDVLDAERVVLPGQGAMPDCMRALAESGLQEAVL